MRVVHNWVIEEIYKPVVVTRSYKDLLVVQVNTVYVRAIFRLGVYAAHIPAQLDRSSCPNQVFGSGGTSRVVDLVSNVEVKLFVVTTARSYIGTVSRPVNGLNV